MAASTEPKLKLPGESTTNPSFAAPQIQTAPDVAKSQAVAGNAPKPPAPTPNGVPDVAGNSTVIPPKPTVTSATPSSSAPATPTVPTSTGAPPGVPNTATMASVPTTTAPATASVPPPPTVGEVPTLKSTQGKNAAEDEWIQAQNENAMKLYEAALAYNGGPTGALEAAQRAAEQGLRSSTANRGAAGTIESSLYGDDKTLISRNQALADTKAYNVYQEAITAANAALNKAQIAYARAQEQEKREMAEAAERREQTEAIEKAAAAQAAPSAPPPSYPIPPAQQEAINHGVQPGPGGVVPYEGGGVRVGKPRR